MTGSGITGILTLTNLATVGATQLSLSSPLPSEMEGRIWLALDPYTASCEIVRVATIDTTNNKVTIETAWGTIKKNHPADTKVAILEDTEVTPQLFGAACDGTTDDAPAFNAALQATGRVLVPPGRYAVSNITISQSALDTNKGMYLRGAYGSVYSVDKTSHLIAYLGTNAILTLGDTMLTGPPNHVTVENLWIDGNKIATTGIHLQKTISATLRHLSVIDCKQYGYLIDNTDRGQVDEVVIDSCYSTRNGSPASPGGGYILKGVTVPNTGSGTNITLQNCRSDADYGAACYVDHAPLTSIRNCQFQTNQCAKTDNQQPVITDGIVIVASNPVSIENTYIEVTGTRLVVRGASAVQCLNSNVFDMRIEDDASTVVANGSHINAASQYTPFRQVLNNMANDAGWGPPNWPNVPDKPNATYQKGFTWIDAYGVVWICTHAAQALKDYRFIARDGRIIIPCYADTIGAFPPPANPNWAMPLANGQLIWFPQEDMVIQRVSFVVTQEFTTSYTSGQNLQFSTSSNDPDNLIQTMDSTALKPKAIFTAAMNANTNPSPKPNPPALGTKALLSPPGSEYYMVGSPTAAPREGIYSYLLTSGSKQQPPWTSGAGYLIIEGYYLRFNLRHGQDPTYLP